MTPKDFTASVSDRLRRRGARFRQEDLEAFMAAAWLQEARRMDPDVWVERFLAESSRYDRMRSVRRRRAVLRWVAWMAPWAVAGLLGALGWCYFVTRWPGYTLLTTAVILIIAALILTRFPPQDRIIRWGVATGLLALLGAAALVVLLATTCHI